MASDTPRSGSPKTLSIGGATFDLFIKTGASVIREYEDGKMFSLPLGGKIRISDVVSTGGGGANNTAVGLARLGCAAAFSGVIGEDQWGEAIQANFKKENVSMEYLVVIEHEPSSFSVILIAESGERTILTHKSMDRHFHDVTFDRDAARAADAIYLNHIHHDTCVIEDDIIEILSTVKNTHLSWNPGGVQIELGLAHTNNRLLIAETNLLLLNKEEALQFSGKKTVKEAMHVLIQAGAKIVCVTDGSKGSRATDGKTLYSCPAPECPVTDTTGAGDSFGSAMTWAIITGKDLPTALKAGTINAMSVVGSVGAQTGLLTQTRMLSELTRTDIPVASEPF
jgi:sugar/nucleoside kinase (ribokinase family)